MRLKGEQKLELTKFRKALSFHNIKELRSRYQKTTLKSRHPQESQVTIARTARIQNRISNRIHWFLSPIARQISRWARILFFGNLLMGSASTLLIAWSTDVENQYRNIAQKQNDLEIASLRDTIIKLCAKVAETKSEVKSTNAHAERAQLELKRFRAARTISHSDGDKLITALSHFANTEVAIYVLGEDPESNSLGLAISDVLSRARWRPLIWNWIAAGGATGLIVLHKATLSSDIITASDALVTAFNSIHITAVQEIWPGDWEHFSGMLRGQNPPSPTAAPVRIIIGSKPH